MTTSAVAFSATDPPPGPSPVGIAAASGPRRPSWRAALRRRLSARTASVAGVSAFVLLVVTIGLAARSQSFPIAPLRVVGLVLACLGLGLAAWAPRPALGLAVAGLAVSGATAVVPLGTYVAAVAAVALVARTDRRGGAVGAGAVVALFGLGSLLPATNQWDNLEIPLPDPSDVAWFWAPLGLVVVAAALLAPRRPVGEPGPVGSLLGRMPVVTRVEVLVVAAVVVATALRSQSLFASSAIRVTRGGAELLLGLGTAALVAVFCLTMAATAVSPWFPRTGLLVSLAGHTALVGSALGLRVLSVPSPTAASLAALYVVTRWRLGRHAAAGDAARRAGPTVVLAALATAALVVADLTLGLLREWAYMIDRGVPLSDVLRTVVLEAVVLAVLLPGLTVAGGWVVTRWLADRDRLAGAAVREAAAAERTRIARELHDVVAHHVSLVTVRAESAPYQVADLSEPAKQAFGEIATTSRRALDDLRDVLGVLGRGDDAVPGGERAPQPTLADVPALVAAARDAGARVGFDSLPGAALAPDVPAGTALAAHAVVREALSNARRHAPGEEVTVSVTQDDGTLRVEVSNPLPRNGSATQGRSGLGLVGLRERVLAAGGSFTAGPDGARWVVVAALPLRRASGPAA